MSDPVNIRELRHRVGVNFDAHLTALINEHAGISAVQICTSDGFAVSTAQGDDASARRLAAMVSSLYALGVAMAEEMELGSYQHLSIDAAKGKCVLFSVPNSDGRLLLAAIANDGMLWGRLLFACRSVTEELGKSLASASAAALAASRVGR